MKQNKIVKEMAIRQLVFYKGRTLVTAATIALSVALMVVVLMFFHSDQERNRRAAINEIGAYHAQYDHLTEEQLRHLQQNQKFKKTYAAYNIKNVSLEPFVEKKIDMAVVYTEGIEDGLIALKEGRAPRTPNEIVLDEWVIGELGYAPTLGQEIKMKARFDEKASHTSEVITFTLVGINEDISVRKAARAGLMLVSEPFIHQNATKPDISLFVLLNSDFNATSVARNIGIAEGLNDAQIIINERYMGAYEWSPVSIFQMIILVMIVVLCAGMVIYNIFNIHVSQKIRLFGMLRAIGMSAVQIRRMIVMEGIVLGVWGSTIGVILGIAGSFVVLPWVGERISGSTLEVQISWVIIVASWISGIALVRLCIEHPIRKSTAGSEIEAMKYKLTGETGYAGGISSRPLNSKIGIWGLSLLQQFRSKKRTIITVASITFTGLIFMTSASILYSMNINNLAGSMVPGDFKISLAGSSGGAASHSYIQEKTMNQVKQIEGVREVLTEKYDGLIYNKTDARKHLNHWEEIKGSRIIADIYGYDPNLLQKAIDRTGGSSEILQQMKEGNYLIAISEDGTYQAGDKVRMASLDDQGKEEEYTIIAVLPTYMTYRGSASEGGIFVAHEDLFERVGLDPTMKQISVTVDPPRQRDVEQQLKRVIGEEPDLILTSFQDIYQEYSESKRLMEVAAYGFISMLMVISVFNLINSNLSSFLARKREISMIEAIGLSRKQLRILIGSEGLVIVVSSILLTILLGTPLGYYSVRLFAAEASYAIYQFPYLALTVLVIFYLVVQWVAIWYMERYLHRSNLMERLRLDG